MKKIIIDRAVQPVAPVSFILFVIPMIKKKKKKSIFDGMQN